MSLLDLVTVTGAANNSDLRHLLDVAREKPWVEFAVLVHVTRFRHFDPVKARYPDSRWVERLVDGFAREKARPVAVHLCGQLVVDLMTKGSMPPELTALRPALGRIQINLAHAVRDGLLTNLAEGQLDAAVAALEPFSETIVQLDYNEAPQPCEQSMAIAEELQKRGCSVSVLYDASAGQGKRPARWPPPVPSFRTGYAGGLSPSTLEPALRAISLNAGGRKVWVDAESGLRMGDDSNIDCGKLADYLAIASRFIGGSEKWR